MPRRNFILTKKKIAQFLGIARGTVIKRMKEANIDDKDMMQVIAWFMFTVPFYGHNKQFPKYNSFISKLFSEYIYTTRGEECEKCHAKNNLQIHHIKPRGDAPHLIFCSTNVLILCRDCHDNAHNGHIPIKNSLFVKKHASNITTD